MAVGLQHALDKVPGVGALHLGHLLRRALGDDGAAAVAALGAQVHDMVGAFDDVEVVLDDEHGVARVDKALQNLKDITAAKGSLIRKALGVEELPIEVGETKVSFPWFAGTPTPEEVKAYDHFICALCEMARNQKRIAAKERDTGNDKYAFRCFLRLGFIGPEYKQERKILLRNLTGSSAFKAVPQKEVADDAASE